MDLQQFIQTTSGHAVTYDNIKANYGQCEQLVCLYWKDVYGFITPPIPYAKDLWTNSVVLESFNQVPVGQEQAGDVAVFGASTQINSPVAGHTDIVLSGIANGFNGYDSNWGGVVDKNAGTPGFGYPAAHPVQHSHVDVLGFLRFKGDSSMDNALVQTQEDAALIYAVGLHSIPTTPVIDSIIGLKVVGALNSIQGTPQWKQEDLVLNTYMPQVCAQLGISDPSTAVATIKSLQSSSGATTLTPGTYRVN